MEKGGKSRNLALKGIEEEIKDFEDEDESEDEDEDGDEDEDLTFITDGIIKLFQFRKRIRANLLRNLNPQGMARMRNPSSNAMSAKVLVI